MQANQFILFCLAFFVSVYSIDHFEYDVVVYGSTPSGIMATIAAGRQGKRVALVSIGNHVGVNQTGGNDSVIGGLALEFFESVTEHYKLPALTLNAEPHVAERLFLKMLTSTVGVDIYFQQRVKESNGVQVNGNTIVSISTEQNATFYAKMFIDATYEGDLMAFSKSVSYTWGRESSSQYNESIAGYQHFIKEENIVELVNPFYPNGTLVPMVTPNPNEQFGQSDLRMEAFSYRLCLTQNTSNSVPIAMPPKYNSDDWILLSRYIDAWSAAHKRAPMANDIFTPFPIENQKTDVCENGNWGISTDFVGGSDNYPNGTYSQREEIANLHYEYVAGLLYFLSNDETVPLSTRKSVSSWGLCADEFIDNNNWPYQLYVREALRMVGDQVFTQQDVDKGPVYRSDSIGMGSWLIDTHQMQRFAIQDSKNSSIWRAVNEGTTWYFPNPHMHFQPYPIPYYVITPKKEEMSNLLVSICISASHVAFNSVRLETQYMILGQAAGVAASLAIDNQVPVQDVEIDQLTKILIQQKAILNL